MTTSDNRLYRSRSDRMVAGVCGGLAKYFNVDPTLVRLVFVVLALAGGPGLLLYLVMWIITPIEP
jgi:phage shock protein C